jgi:hypothetical protein
MGGMAITKQIPRDAWQGYFDRFTREHLQGTTTDDVTIELISPARGDQLEASAMRLQGLAYDPRGRTFQVLLEDLDHLVFDPAEIWVIEQEGGFISTIELVAADGGSELIHIERGGPPARLSDQPSA